MQKKLYGCHINFAICIEKSCNQENVQIWKHVVKRVIFNSICFINFQLIPRMYYQKWIKKQFFDENKSVSIKWFNLGTYFWKLVTIIFASVFKLSVHCTYSIGYRKCSPFFFFFMAFSWPFFLSFYTQDIACRHSLGELSLKKKNLNALHIFSLLGFLFLLFLIHFSLLLFLDTSVRDWLPVLAGLATSWSGPQSPSAS